jgi:hypothetical protein
VSLSLSTSVTQEMNNNKNNSLISANGNQESSLLDLSHLTPDELEQLKKVLKKHQDFEKEIEQSIRSLLIIIFYKFKI